MVSDLDEKAPQAHDGWDCLSPSLYICISMGVGIGNTFRAVFHLHWVGWARIWWFAVLHTASREKIHGAQEWGGCQHYHLCFATGWKKGRLYIVGVIANVPGGTCYFPSTALGSLQVHALVKARIRVPYVSLNPEIVSKRRVHSAQTQMSSITLDSLAITIPLLPVWACAICDKCKSSTKTSLGAKLQGWISKDNCHRILVNPKDRRGSWR